MPDDGSAVTQRKRPTPYWVVGVWWVVLLLNFFSYKADPSPHSWRLPTVVAFSLVVLAFTALVIREHLRRHRREPDDSR